jgi:hypothetical protein
MTIAAQSHNALNTLDLLGPDSASTARPSTQPSRAVVWTGRISIGLGLAFMSFDCVGKLLQLSAVMESSAKAGFKPELIFPLGVIELLCIVPYAFKSTRLLGTVLLSGYFGGAVATHLHMGHPLLSHTLFPLYFAAIFWVGALATVPNLGRLLFGRPNH